MGVRVESIVRLGELAERLGCRLEGDGEIEIDGVRSPADAGPADLTFVTEARHLPRLEPSRAWAALLAESLAAAHRPVLRASSACCINRAIVGAQAGESKDVPDGAIALGAPAVPYLEFKRQLAATARLPQMGKMLRALEARLER